MNQHVPSPDVDKQPPEGRNIEIISFKTLKRFLQIYTTIGTIIIVTNLYYGLFRSEYIIPIILIVGSLIILIISYELSKGLKPHPPKDPRKLINKDLTDTDVEFAIYNLKKKIAQGNFLELEYLFTWEDITGIDTNQLINFLGKIQPLDWIRSPTFTKDGKIITISEGDNSCSLRLNEERTNAILKIADSKNYEFLAKEENSKLKIYRYDPKKNIIIGVDRGGAIVGGMLAKNLGLAITTLAISYANPPKTNLKNIDFCCVKKILLVDDAIRKGGTMKAAWEKVREEWERQECYLFSWEEIQRKDDTKLIEFLTQNYEVNWAKTAKIQQIDNGKTINISDGKNHIFLRLNDERMEVSLTIDNEIDNKFIVKREKKKRNIYKIITKKIDDIVRITCILHQSGAKIAPYYDVYNTNIVDIYFPWDKMHLDEDMEKDKKKQFEELCTH